MPKDFTNDLHIVICGEAGQGINTVENVLIKVLKKAGFHVFATKEYMSRVRGGSNSTSIRVSSDPVYAPQKEIDILIALDPDSISHVADRLTPETLILRDQESLAADPVVLHVPWTAIAANLALPVLSNIVAVGVMASLCAVELPTILDIIAKYFSKKDEETVQKNLQAAQRGFEIGQNFIREERLRVRIPRQSNLGTEILVSGADAVSLGALAGGCQFLSSYPMSPSTGVLTLLSALAKDFDILVEQAEDEISAINMALGASYAGARSMVTTSGGGFALMEEGVSLAGMLETPIVIHLGQRPGPATGLPTRTEQADLEMVLYAGHGEFPRIILAPGTLPEAFSLTQQAFSLTEKFQVPVFLLTDQYLLDTFANTPAFDAAGAKIQSYLVKTEPSYQRYRLTDDGISPRGIPGFGDGLVMVDSDEHGEDGRITEDLELRVRMEDKRRRKMESIRAASVPPVFRGPKKYRHLIIGWGSSFGAIEEAIGKLKSSDIAHLHFSQVHPIHASAAQYLVAASRRVVIEGNATGQFARLLSQAGGVKIEKTILKYNGLPFFVEELVEQIQSACQE